MRISPEMSTTAPFVAVKVVVLSSIRTAVFELTTNAPTLRRAPLRTMNSKSVQPYCGMLEICVTSTAADGLVTPSSHVE